ncbi:DUF2283 domain-containing protein [Candidatus Poribacteria bacterium]|nr:DUF2283 domain-containing protein [Candidatus Poribacteria bacterium]
MAKVLSRKSCRGLTALQPLFDQAPPAGIHLHFDQAADIMYLHFCGTQDASISEHTEGDILVEYDDDNNIVGYTILHASSRG